MRKLDHTPAATTDNIAGLRAENARLRDQFSRLRGVSERAFESGQDRMAADIILLINDMTAADSSCDDLLDAIEQTVIARIEVGIDPAGWFE